MRSKFHCRHGLRVSGNTILDGEFLSSNSENWTATYNIVAAMSAGWGTNGQGTTTTLTRISNNITNPGGEREYVALQSGDSGSDAIYDDINHEHVMVLPKTTILRQVAVRGYTVADTTLKIGMHTNQGAVDRDSKEYIYFDNTPKEEETKTFTEDNQSLVYTFTISAAAEEGDTLGLSLSADHPLDNLCMTIIMEHPDYIFTPLARAHYDPEYLISDLQDQFSQIIETNIPPPTFRVIISDTEENIRNRPGEATGAIAFATDTTKLLVHNKEGGSDRWVEFDNN